MFAKNTTNIFIGCIILLFILYFSYARSSYENFEEDSPASKGIILELWGGLGNQLYLYSAGRAMNKKLNAPIYLVTNSTVKTHTETDYRPILFNDFVAINTDDERLQDKVDVKLQNNFWEPWSTDDIPIRSDKYVYIGVQFLQYFPAIVDVLPEVSDHVLNVLQAKYTDLVVLPKSAFVHIRRGDYTNPGNSTYLLDMDYYVKAMEVFKDKDAIQNIYIFSDEIDWCKQQKWDTKKNIVFINEGDEMKTLYMMSQCREGAIMANSTFSTWGAILGAYRTGSTIVYPSKWLYDGKTDFPKEWIKI